MQESTPRFPPTCKPPGNPRREVSNSLLGGSGEALRIGGVEESAGIQWHRRSDDEGCAGCPICLLRRRQDGSGGRITFRAADVSRRPRSEHEPLLLFDQTLPFAYRQGNRRRPGTGQPERLLLDYGLSMTTRHRHVHSLIAWSYDKLSSNSRSLLSN